jgi:hypothetical protein
MAWRMAGVGFVTVSDLKSIGGRFIACSHFSEVAPRGSDASATEDHCFRALGTGQPASSVSRWKPDDGLGENADQATDRTRMKHG